MAGLVFMIALSYSGNVAAHPHPATDSDHVHEDDIQVHMIGESLNGNIVDKISLAEKIQAGGITIDMSTVKYTDSDNAVGIFENGHSVSRFELDSGIILSTGYAKAAEQDNTFPLYSRSNSLLGDADLDSIIEEQGGDTSIYGTHDATVLEFEFTATRPLLCVRYIFASDEYKEFVGAGYDDIFAFLVRKKGTTEWTNIAKVPYTDDNVSIDNVNSGKNAYYYRDNEYSSTVNKPFQFDGFTGTMCAGVENCTIEPGETYEIKIAIADVYDDEIDTAIFIDAITDVPDYLSITTWTLPSQEVGTSYSTTIEADGSAETDYVWKPCVEDTTKLGADRCSCVTEMSLGLPSDLLVGNCPVILSNGPKSAEFSWILPVVPEGEYINILVEVQDSLLDYYATAEIQYTDPEVASGSGGGAGAGGGGCFITTAAYGGNYNIEFTNKYPMGALLLIGFAVVPFIYRRVKK